ncbi:MAG: response regulator transcription factor, partial [Epsilonproteobacteria bacterium]|nr:response regulator transcription factor [Campylobacterota bacterium]
DGESALDKTYEKIFDLYLFDVNVDKINGFELLSSLRESKDTTPSIFLTAMGDIASIAQGFDVGADDYIKKPFEFEELLIRIKAILKKRYKTYDTQIEVGEFTFNVEKEELYKQKSFISLPPIELVIVKALFQNRTQTLSKDFLIDITESSSEGALRVHINKLRKIGLPIQTVKGVGYRLS